MEISIIDAENVPPGCLLSLAPNGMSKRQAPLRPQQKFSWSSPGNDRTMRIDVISVLGSIEVAVEDVCSAGGRCDVVIPIVSHGCHEYEASDNRTLPLCVGLNIKSCQLDKGSVITSRRTSLSSQSSCTKDAPAISQSVIDDNRSSVLADRQQTYIDHAGHIELPQSVHSRLSNSSSTPQIGRKQSRPFSAKKNYHHAHSPKVDDSITPSICRIEPEGEPSRPSTACHSRMDNTWLLPGYEPEEESSQLPEARSPTSWRYVIGESRPNSRHSMRRSLNELESQTHIWQSFETKFRQSSNHSRPNSASQSAMLKLLESRYKQSALRPTSACSTLFGSEVEVETALSHDDRGMDGNTFADADETAAPSWCETQLFDEGKAFVDAECVEFAGAAGRALRKSRPSTAQQRRRSSGIQIVTHSSVSCDNSPRDRGNAEISLESCVEASGTSDGEAESIVAMGRLSSVRELDSMGKMSIPVIVESDKCQSPSHYDSIANHNQISIQASSSSVPKLVLEENHIDDTSQPSEKIIAGSRTALCIENLMPETWDSAPQTPPSEPGESGVLESIDSFQRSTSAVATVGCEPRARVCTSGHAADVFVSLDSSQSFANHPPSDHAPVEGIAANPHLTTCTSSGDIGKLTTLHATRSAASLVYEVEPVPGTELAVTPVLALVERTESVIALSHEVIDRMIQTDLCFTPRSVHPLSDCEGALKAQIETMCGGLKTDALVARGRSSKDTSRVAANSTELASLDASFQNKRHRSKETLDVAAMAQQRIHDSELIPIFVPCDKSPPDRGDARLSLESCVRASKTSGGEAESSVALNTLSSVHELDSMGKMSIPVTVESDKCQSPSNNDSIAYHNPISIQASSSSVPQLVLDESHIDDTSQPSEKIIAGSRTSLCIENLMPETWDSAPQTPPSEPGESGVLESASEISVGQEESIVANAVSTSAKTSVPGVLESDRCLSPSHYNLIADQSQISIEASFISAPQLVLDESHIDGTGQQREDIIASSQMSLLNEDSLLQKWVGAPQKPLSELGESSVIESIDSFQNSTNLLVSDIGAVERIESIQTDLCFTPRSLHALSICELALKAQIATMVEGLRINTLAALSRSSKDTSRVASAKSSEIDSPDGTFYQKRYVSACSFPQCRREREIASSQDPNPDFDQRESWWSTSTSEVLSARSERHAFVDNTPMVVDNLVESQLVALATS